MNAPVARPRPLFAAIFVAAFAASAAADYLQSFRKGIEAIDIQDWPSAAQWMQKAVAEQPREGERVRIVNVRFETYLPHYYLGLALYHQGDCAGALRSWETSEQQGAVRSAADEYGILKGLRDECRRKTGPAPVPAAPTVAAPFPAEELKRAQGELARAAEAEAAVASLRRDPALAAVWLDRPALGSRADGAIGKVATASSWVEAGRARGDAAQLSRAAALTAEAIGELQAVRQEVEARRDELRQARAATPAPAREAPTAAPPAAVRTGPAAPVPAPQGARGPIAAQAPATPAPQRGRPAPPAELRAAAEAFLAADYARTVQIVNGAAFAEPRAAALALLLRGAARYSLYLAGGRRDVALLQASMSDARGCRRLVPAFTPDTAFFSPAYAELFRGAR